VNSLILRSCGELQSASVCVCVWVGFPGSPGHRCRALAYRRGPRELLAFSFQKGCHPHPQWEISTADPSPTAQAGLFLTCRHLFPGTLFCSLSLCALQHQIDLVSRYSNLGLKIEVRSRRTGGTVQVHVACLKISPECWKSVALASTRPRTAFSLQAASVTVTCCADLEDSNESTTRGNKRRRDRERPERSVRLVCIRDRILEIS